MTIRPTPPQAIDPDRLSLMLSELRLPSIETEWRNLAQRADKEGWPASRFLFSLAELELTERDNWHLNRHTRQAKLLPGKNLEGFDFSVIPSPPKARVQAFASEDSWIRKGANLLIFGPLASARATSPPPSASPSCARASRRSSPEPPASSRKCRSLNAISITMDCPLVATSSTSSSSTIFTLQPILHQPLPRLGDPDPRLDRGLDLVAIAP